MPRTPVKITAATVRLMATDEERAVKMVAAAVEADYDVSVVQYKVNPSADNFTSLHNAMHALQYWRGCDNTERLALANKLRDRPVVMWSADLRAAQMEAFK